jgi:hypothetical protein
MAAGGIDHGAIEPRGNPAPRLQKGVFTLY